MMVELLVRPTSATRPIVCGKLAAPIGLPVLKKYSADVALGAFVKKSPTLRNHSFLSDANLLGWQYRQDCVVHGKGCLQVGCNRRHPPVIVRGIWHEVAEQDSVYAARDVVVVRRIHCLACVVLRS